ncbi:MAG: hypothetical protein QXM16_05935 [Nitrososphaerota archaeon]
MAPPLFSAYCVKGYIPYLVVGIRELVLDIFTGIQEGVGMRMVEAVMRTIVDEASASVAGEVYV